VLYTHPVVLEAAVIGIPDKRWGEAVHAVVVCREGKLVSEADLIAHCREQIASYKAPKSGPGKVLKRVLREPFWEGDERSIN
jgi:long-chain acyl-CoA synthetase